MLGSKFQLSSHQTAVCPWASHLTYLVLSEKRKKKKRLNRISKLSSIFSPRLSPDTDGKTGQRPVLCKRLSPRSQMHTFELLLPQHTHFSFPWAAPVFSMLPCSSKAGPPQSPSRSVETLAPIHHQQPLPHISDTG